MTNSATLHCDPKFDARLQADCLQAVRFCCDAHHTAKVAAQFAEQAKARRARLLAARRSASPFGGHDIGCAVADGIACDCR